MLLAVNVVFGALLMNIKGNLRPFLATCLMDSLPTSMSLSHILVTESLNLLMSDISVLKLVIKNLERPSWARMKYSRTALDTILNRWDDGSSIELLIDELLLLKTPEKWEQWIQISEQQGVRVDIWEAQTGKESQTSGSEWYRATSGPLRLWIGEDNAAGITWRTLFPGCD